MCVCAFYIRSGHSIFHKRNVPKIVVNILTFAIQYFSEIINILTFAIQYFSEIIIRFGSIDRPTG